ncbi:hypothetical protein LEMLEM_LOCUS19807 [Lemmus lemmus]
MEPPETDNGKFSWSKLAGRLGTNKWLSPSTE